MAWWDIEYGEIRMMTAAETAAFVAEVARDDRISALRNKFYDHRRKRTSFIPPLDAQGNEITEKFSRMDIYTRDEGICQLCLAPLNLMVTAPDPAALSIDHIDSEGPHTLANCRLAHLFCNNDAQVTKGLDAELARARLHHKLATQEKAGPGDRFPRRSPLTGHVVNSDEWRRHASTFHDRANTQTKRATAQTITQRLSARMRSLFSQGRIG